MTYRATAEAMRRARELLHLQEDADLDTILAGLAAFRLKTEALNLIANSRKSIQPQLRQTLDECQADYDEERAYGWACEGRDE